MSKVMFATNCDICGKRSEEYTSWLPCWECGHDICPDCKAAGEHFDERGMRALWCKTCAGDDE
jgi:hypothetical protein